MDNAVRQWNPQYSTGSNQQVRSDFSQYQDDFISIVSPLQKWCAPSPYKIFVFCVL